MPPAEPTTALPEPNRRARIRSFRREMVIEAAARLFAERGLEATSMRLIAAETGCTTGALYADFAGREEIYAEVLSRSLVELDAAVRDAIDNAENRVAAAKAAAWAFFDYYAARPESLALGLYLYQGLNPAGLRPDLDGALNAQLSDIHAAVRQSFAAAAVPEPAEAATAALAQVVGLLVLGQSGRLKLFASEAGAQMKAYLDSLFGKAAITV